MERLDKIISNHSNYTRKDIKKLVLSKKVVVNNVIADSYDMKIDSNKSKIIVNGEEIIIKEFVYLMLNKPKGFVSATTDKNENTVLELVPEKYSYRNLFPAGRLDKDTTGLMIITDDGQMAHNILAPKKHVKKLYKVIIDIPLTNQMVQDFENGIKLNDGECKSALLEIIDEKECLVTLVEGRYHQIKRMFGCFGAKVIELHRLAMGNLFLPEDLESGKCRELSYEELLNLQEK